MKSNTKVLLSFAALVIITLSQVAFASKSFMKKTEMARNNNNNYNNMNNQRNFRNAPPANTQQLGDSSSSSSSSANSNSANSNSANANGGKKEEQPAWANLVTVTKPKALCKTDEDKKYKTPSDKMKLPGDYNVYGPPYNKTNNYISAAGHLDQIQYFFDYLDDVFQKDLTGEFQALINDAKAIQEEADFDDPYSTDKLMFYWSNGQQGRDPVKDDGKPQVIKSDELKKYRKWFDSDDWDNSFSAGKIAAIIKAFGWSSNSNMPFFWKRLIDKYDFDGNGRLNAREFLFYAIWENHKNYQQCKKHCFKKIIDEKINPLFTFFDCDTDGYIDSENLWAGTQYLKRTNEKFDFYKCEVPRPYNKFYRTHAPNDFVLRNWDVADGYLNREEFRKGILLGYWDRQSKGNTIVTDDSVNGKAKRWDATGVKDLDCNELLAMYNGHH